MAKVDLSIMISAIDQASSTFAKIGMNATQSFKNIEGSLEAADKAGQKFARTSQLLQQASIGVALAGTAFGLAIKKSADESANFEQAMRNVNSIAKLSEQQFQALEESVKGIAADGQVTDSVNSLANGLYDIYSSGLTGKDALDTLAIASKGAAAGLTDTATASNVLVAAMNAYGQKSGADAQHFMDVMFKTVERGVVTFDQLAGSMGNVMGTAAQVGVGVEELGAGISTMTKQGIGAEESITSLNGILMQFLSPNEKLRDLMKSYGYESGLAILQTKGLSGSMQWLSDATGGNAATMADLLGDVRAVRGAMALTGAGTQMFTEDLAAMQNAAGSAGAALEEQAKGPVFQAKVMLKQLNLAITEFGEKWVEAFGKVAPILTKFLEKVTELLQTDLGGKVAFWGSVFVGLGIILASVIITIGTSIIWWNMLTAAMLANAEAATVAGAANAGAGVGFGTLGRILMWFRGLWPLISGAVAAWAATLGPVILGALSSAGAAIMGGIAAIGTFLAGLPLLIIGAIVLAIVALGVGIWQLVKHWDTVKAWFGNIGANMSEWLSGVWDAIAQFFSNIPYAIGEWLGEAYNNVSYWIGFIIGAFQAMPGAIAQWLGEAWTNIKQWVVDSYNSFVEWAQNVPTVIGDALVNIYNSVVAWAQSLPGAIADGINSFVDTIKQGFADAWSAVTGFFTGIYDYLRELPGRMWQSAKDAAGAFINGFKAGNEGGGASAGQQAGQEAFGGYRAAGGAVRAGTAYVVGEKGPELFMPGANGSVVPNGMAAKMAAISSGSGGIDITLHTDGSFSMVTSGGLQDAVVRVVNDMQLKPVRAY